MTEPDVSPFLRPIMVKERLYVPLEYVQNPFGIIEELTIKNMGHKTKTHDTFYGVEGKKGGARIVTKEDKADYSLIEMAWIEPDGDYLVVPRCYPIWEKLYPCQSGEYPVESYVVIPDRWKHITLGKDNIILGPNESIRYNQTAAWEALFQPLEFPYGKILGLGCGKGKTVLALKLAHHRHVPTIVVCHTRQMQAEWAKTVRAPWCLNLPEHRIGYIGDGKCDWKDKDIVFTTMPGLVCRQYPQEFWDYFGLAIFDEGDLLGATELSQMLPKFIGERILLTATIEREDGQDAIYYNHIGPICYYDVMPDLTPHCIVYDSALPERDRAGEEITQRIWMPTPHGVVLVPHIPKTLTKIVMEYPERRTWAMDIVKDRLDEGRKILFLGERVRELKTLNRKATEQWPKYKSGLALGGQHTTPKEIEHTLNTCDIIWGIQHIAKRGLNKPSIDTIVIQYCCFKKEGRLRQTIGRALRYFNGKHEPLVILLNDPKIEVFDNKAKILTYMLREMDYKVEWYEHNSAEGNYTEDIAGGLYEIYGMCAVNQAVIEADEIEQARLDETA